MAKAEEKPRIHLNDIVDGVAKREVATFTANGVSYWSDRISKDQLATHRDCEECGVEFKKPYTYSKYCYQCSRKKETEKYRAMPVEIWNGKDALCLFNDDRYFFDEDDIEQYCEENRLYKSELKLVLCAPTSFSEINVCDLLQDDVHEDWEPDKDLIRLEKQLNDYLKEASTNTWMPTKFRVQLID